MGAYDAIDERAFGGARCEYIRHFVNRLKDHEIKPNYYDTTFIFLDLVIHTNAFLRQRLVRNERRLSSHKQHRLDLRYHEPLRKVAHAYPIQTLRPNQTREREFQPAAKGCKPFDAGQERDDAGTGLEEGLVDEQCVLR